MGETPARQHLAQLADHRLVSVKIRKAHGHDCKHCGAAGGRVAFSEIGLWPIWPAGGGFAWYH
jgi:hypothetical protein